jgi:deoxyribonuclease-1-like protein
MKNRVRLGFLIVVIFFNYSLAQVSICSWNLKDFGRAKSDSEINYIANTVKDFDVVLIQEVVANDPAGAQAVSRLSDALNRKGSKWDYTVSDPTSGTSYKRERYAFIWKTSKLSKVGNAWLEKRYSLEIDREPFYCTFKTGSKYFTLVNFHAITKTLHPEAEIKYFNLIPYEYPGLNLVFCGDFNCPQTHEVFNTLKDFGYRPILRSQKTSLRQQCINDDCLASEYDNIFYNHNKIVLVEAGVIHFYKYFNTLVEALSISDHIPIYFKFNVN